MKKILAIALASVMVLSLAACGQSAPAPAPALSAPTSLSSSLAIPQLLVPLLMSWCVMSSPTRPPSSGLRVTQRAVGMSITRPRMKPHGRLWKVPSQNAATLSPIFGL